MLRVEGIYQSFGGNLDVKVNAWIKEHSNKYEIVNIKFPSERVAYVIYRVRGDV